MSEQELKALESQYPRVDSDKCIMTMAEFFRDAQVCDLFQQTQAEIEKDAAALRANRALRMEEWSLLNGRVVGHE